MTGNEIRKRFLEYFENKHHTVVKSSPLIPHSDPTLLFINAGMNQFKDVFLGREKRDYVRAASSQKCVRAGGKHNDLENVGHTARHHTFFEMLGNFSFGDYFKTEAIRFAWEFLTQEMKLPQEKLWATVFREDDEAYDIWKNDIKVPVERIVRMGEKDNFWSMGDTGPCGPCSEILIDQGEEMSCGDNCGIGKCDCDRYLELWNLVFMQFNRDDSGDMAPLPKPSIDTGMGLERISAVVQGVQSNYDCDLLRGIIATIEKLSGKTYGSNEEDSVSMRVIADHSRAVAFLISDGILPSNEGRGYVLRRIMRRAARHAKMLGFNEPVLHKTCLAVMDAMSEAYPELVKRKSYVGKVVLNEEERFLQTLDNGLHLLTEEIAKLENSQNQVFSGAVAFRLYDTFGFPLDLTEDIIAAKGLSVDNEEFAKCMEAQREKAREHWKGSGEEAVEGIYKELVREGLFSGFCGYQTVAENAKVLALVKEGKPVETAREGDTVDIIVDNTPFYGESGGQVGDRGEIRTATAHFQVMDTKKPVPELTVHKGKVVSGDIKKGDKASLSVDQEARQATALNHTATHILQAALVKILGDHIKQAGSLVSPERLRFDFTHFSPLSRDEIRQVEKEVNANIRGNFTVETKEMTTEEAIKAGATALFGEKYGDSSRVVRMGEFSMELCGGTHAESSGNIGFFKILHETGIAAGVRRIEAATGARALETIQEQEALLERTAGLLKSDPSNLETRVQKLLERQKELEREVEKLNEKMAANQAGDLMDNVRTVEGINLLAVKVPGEQAKTLRDMGDQLRDKLKSGVVVLGCENNGKVNLLVSVTKDLAGKVHAGQLIKTLAEQVGGKGGGRPDFAQAGGSKPEKLDATLEKTEEFLKNMVGAS
ncbi:MAG: alanine--tRNA ligase [Deltaproteobacteria bacterium]|nr:alanine--tRNA ligase [Deltaproteobacteria bacterium]